MAKKTNSCQWSISLFRAWRREEEEKFARKIDGKVEELKQHLLDPLPEHLKKFLRAGEVDLIGFLAGHTGVGPGDGVAEICFYFGHNMKPGYHLETSGFEGVDGLRQRVDELRQYWKGEIQLRLFQDRENPSFMKLTLKAL